MRYPFVIKMFRVLKICPDKSDNCCGGCFSALPGPAEDNKKTDCLSGSPCISDHA